MTDVPDALVEKAARALFRTIHGYDGYDAEKPTVRNAMDTHARAVLAAVCPPDCDRDHVPCTRQRWLEDDLPAARPVVEGDCPDGCTEHRTCRPCTCEGDPDDPAMADPYCPRHSAGRDERAQDAADVRRAVAEPFQRLLDEWRLTEFPDERTADLMCLDLARLLTGIAHEVGERS